MNGERSTYVDYVWKDDQSGGRALVVILNDKELYDQMAEDDSYDARIWFYFQDEDEFQRAFNTNNTEFEFVLTREEK
jgi:hypothetical protein